jgi:hypothetical protein
VSGRWIALWHKNDEAMQGLRSLNTFEFRIFDDDYAAGFWSFLSILLLPAMFFTLLLTSAPLTYLCADASTYYGFTCYDTTKLSGRIDTVVFTLKKWFGLEDSTHTSLASHIVVPIIFFLVSIVLIKALQLFGSLMDALTGKILNTATWRQVRSLAIGNDVAGEAGVSIDHYPPWVSRRFEPLPADLGQKISKLADEAAAKSISKFRNAIEELAFADGKRDKTAIVADYLSWNELIHTSYFDVEPFRKFVALALCQGDDFQPTESFKNDADYVAVEGWLQGLLAGTGSRQSSSDPLGDGLGQGSRKMAS